MKNINLKKEVSIDYLINAILIIIIACGIFTSIYMLFVSRSLWLDEAALAYSVSQRNLINLTSSPLEWVQTAPIIFIYIVKIITIILGNTEITLRLFSVISYLLILFIAHKISKNILKLQYPLFPVAYVASMRIILRYSNEFKSYIFDAVVCMTILYMYYLYNKKKMSFKFLIIGFMISIWASNPSCFFIGGVLLTEFIIALKKKNYKHIKNIIIGAIGVFCSFIIYYFYWLRAVAQNPAMQNYWKGQNFPLIPNSLENLKKAKSMFFEIISAIDRYQLLIALFSVLSILIGIYQKNKYKIVILFSVLIALFASFINMFPIQDRMWLFIYPIIILLAFDALNKLFINNKYNKIVFLGLSLFLILQNIGINMYLTKENLYIKTDEVNMTMDYLEKNIKEDEKIYVYHIARPAFEYKNGYANPVFGKYNNEVIYQDGDFMVKTVIVETERIVNEDKVYIVVSHYHSESDDSFIELTKKGYLELVTNPYNTPLYYYVKDIQNMKSKVSYEIEKAECINGKYLLTLNINNIGQTIINHRFENVYIGSKENRTIKAYLKDMLLQNENYKITLELFFNNDDEINLQLCSEDNYWFDELGIEPIKVEKTMFEIVNDEKKVD